MSNQPFTPTVTVPESEVFQVRARYAEVHARIDRLAVVMRDLAEELSGVDQAMKDLYQALPQPEANLRRMRAEIGEHALSVEARAHLLKRDLEAAAVTI